MTSLPSRSDGSGDALPRTIDMRVTFSEDEVQAMTTLSRTFPVARWDIPCSSCRSLIARGERYHRWVGTGDEWDGLATLKECGRCFDRYERYRTLLPADRVIADAWATERGVAS